MKVTVRRFLVWLGHLSLLMRCFVIALLVHMAFLLVLSLVKVVEHFPREIFTGGFEKVDRLPPVDIGRNDLPDEPGGYQPKIDTEPKQPTIGQPPGLPGGGRPTGNDRAPDVIGRQADWGEAADRVVGEPGGKWAKGLPDGMVLSSLMPPKGPFIRDPLERKKRREELGGSDKAEEAILAALRWLKKQQNDDGSWDCDRSKAAGTALSLLAFLGHGETDKSKEFGGAVYNGILYLTKCVGDDGLVRDRNMYAQGVVTLALAEAYGMTGAKAIREPLERSIKALLAAQKIEKASQQAGGWRYAITSADSDTSVSGWVIMALKSAQLAGIEIPADAFQQASQYLWNVYAEDGGFGYAGPKRTPNMTGVGVLCQQFLGHGGDPRLKRALDYLKQQKLDWDGTNDGFAMYGWYYISQAMYHAGGAYWTYWNGQMRDTLVKAQKDDGRWEAPAGSKSEVGMNSKPVYPTALGCLMLEVYYRHAPLYKELGRHQPTTPTLKATR